MGTKKDLERAIKHFKNAAIQIPFWKKELIETLLMSSDRNYQDDAIVMLNEGINRGDASSLGRMGELCWEGIIVEKDLHAAEEYLTAAFEKDRLWFNKLFDLLWSINTPASKEKMIDIANRTIDEGFLNAAGRLGRAYRDGRGVGKDLIEASDYYKKAISVNLGWSNEYFDVLWDINTVESKKMMISVAERSYLNGDGGSAYRLGKTYRDGRGVQRDYSKACQYFEFAFKKNDTVFEDYINCLIISGSDDNYQKAHSICLSYISTKYDLIARRYLIWLNKYGLIEGGCVDKALQYIFKDNIMIEELESEYVQLLFISDDDKYNSIKQKYLSDCLVRGYCLFSGDYWVPSKWNKMVFEADKKRYILAYDPLLQVTQAKSSKSEIISVGIILDPLVNNSNPLSVCSRLCSCLDVSEESFYNYLDGLCGTFLLIYVRNNRMCVTQDATGSKAMYYSSTRDIYSSHYNLLQYNLNNRVHPFFKQYEMLKNKPWTLPGNITPFESIFAMVPNHKIDADHNLSRIWPRAPMMSINTDEYMEYSAKYLLNELKLLVDSHFCLMSITGGRDSRISLASSNHNSDKIKFFTFGMSANPREDLFKKDYEIVSKLSDYLDLKAKRLLLRERTPHEKAIAMVRHYNLPYPESIVFKSIYPQADVHIRSTLIEIVRNPRLSILGWDKPSNTGIPAKIAMWQGWGIKESVNIFKKYLEDTEFNESCLMGFPIQELIFWEYRMGIWANGPLSDNDGLAVNTIMLFNCRKLLGDGIRMADEDKGDKYVDRLVGMMWPELLKSGIRFNK